MKRFRLVVLTALAVLPLAVPGPASAEKSACRRGSGCVWDQTSYRGKMTQIPSSGCIDSRIRSAVNTSDVPLQFFMGAGCYGPRAGTLQPGQETPEISAGSATGDCSRGPVDGCSDETAPETPTTEAR